MRRGCRPLSWPLELPGYLGRTGCRVRLYIQTRDALHKYLAGQRSCSSRGSPQWLLASRQKSERCSGLGQTIGREAKIGSRQAAKALACIIHAHLCACQSARQHELVHVAQVTCSRGGACKGGQASLFARHSSWVRLNTVQLACAGCTSLKPCQACPTTCCSSAVTHAGQC